MTVRINKSAFNIREKLSELERPIGLKGSELMRAETAQEARDFVSAGRKNLVINGDMRISQRGTSFTPATEFGYTLDRWITFLSQTGSFNVTQETTSPPDGFTHYLRVTSTAATSSITGRNLLCQMVEGFNLAPTKWGFSDAKPCKISFWVRSSLPGKHGFTINDTSQRPCFGKGYYINQANTWEYKEIFVPPATFGDFSLNTNGRGCWLFWDMGSASGYDVPVEGIWNDTQNDYSVPGTVDIIATNGATFDITGVQLEVGKNATEFEHRSYGEELELCQRYYQKYNLNYFVPTAYGSTLLIGNVYFPVEMRVHPTASLVGSIDRVALAGISNVSSTVTLSSYYGNDGKFSELRFSSSVSLTNGLPYIIYPTSSVYAEFNSEL